MSAPFKGKQEFTAKDWDALQVVRTLFEEVALHGHAALLIFIDAARSTRKEEPPMIDRNPPPAPPTHTAATYTRSDLEAVAREAIRETLSVTGESFDADFPDDDTNLAASVVTRYLQTRAEK